MRALTALPSCTSALVATMSPSGTGASSSFPCSELPHGCARTEAAELQRQSLAPRDDEPLRAADELERARDEARRGSDDSQRVRKPAPGRAQPDRQSRGVGAEIRLGLREEPVRRRVSQPRDAAKGGGNRRRRIVQVNVQRRKSRDAFHAVQSPGTTVPVTGSVRSGVE